MHVSREVGAAPARRPGTVSGVDDDDDNSQEERPCSNVNGPQVTTPSAAAYEDTDGRPPSIHLSEHVHVDVSPSATASPTQPPHEVPVQVQFPDSPDSPDSDEQPQMPRPPNTMSTTTTRTRRTTLDLPGSPIDVLYESDHKLALEGTSPKPCIVPGNALHLIDDDPSAPRSATPPSLIIVGDDPEGESEYEGEGEVGGDGPEGVGVGGGKPPAAAGTRPTPRVRFRSRVRITSGVHRHRHSHSQSGTAAPGSSTPGSSTEDSPSSSISAPLRYQADENATWGPIGKRLSGYAAGGWQRRPEGVQGQGQRQRQVQVQVQVQGQDGQRQGVYGARIGGARGRGARGGRGYHERTPLLRPSPGRTYSESEDGSEEGMGEEERTARAAMLSREEEAVFGKWPWRIFNRHVSARPVSAVGCAHAGVLQFIVVVVACRACIRLLLLGRVRLRGILNVYVALASRSL